MLPRQAAATHHCIECSTKLEPWEGQAEAREYWFSPREVGLALAMVAGGESYRRAGRAAREMARRTNPAMGGSRRRSRDSNLDGQLVANWVDALAPVITHGALPKAWPERVALDSVEFRLSGGPNAGKSFHVMAAVGYDGPTARPRVWLVRASPSRTQADWEAFLEELEGTPRWVVTDMDAPLSNAVSAVFPREGDPAPNVRLCELPLRRSIENALAPLASQAQHPVLRALKYALFDYRGWTFFEGQVKHTDQLAAPALPAMMRWLRRYGPQVATQMRSRTSAGPNSTGAVEAALRHVDRALLGRSQRLGNRTRMNLLLDLMTLHANGAADARLWAARLRERLYQQGGVAPRQRPHDDHRHRPSLLS